MFAKSSSLVSKETLTTTETGNLTELILLYPKTQSAIPIVKEYLKWTKYNQSILNCINIAQEKQVIDIIHLNTIFPACIPTLNVIKKLKCPLFITEHWTGYSPEDGNYRGFVIQHYTKKIIEKALTVITVSDYLKKMMESHQLHANYVTIPNVVDTDLFLPTIKVTTDITSFIHISSLDDAQKNVSGIISAFASALKHNNKLRLTIVGEATSKVIFQELTKQLNIENDVHFVGRLIGIDLVQEINKSDVLVMFSNYETFCLVIPECFACGRPAITSRVGGVLDYMKPELGMLVDPKNEAQLTESFLTFAQTKHHYNSELIRKFAVTHFSKQIINQKLTALYQSALA